MKTSEKILKYSIGVLFLLLYMLVATISAICSIDFFNLSHSQTMSICLAIAFELGAMCSLCAGVFMKSNRTLSFSLFILLTLFQMMGNVFHSYTNLTDGFINWIELFGLVDLELIAQKRVVAAVSGAILPIVALGFIKCFVDYNDKEESSSEDKFNDKNTNSTVEIKPKEIINSEIQEKIPIKENLINKNINVKPVEHKKQEQKNNNISNKPEKQNIVSKLFHKKKLQKQEELKNEKQDHKIIDIDPSTLI